MSEPTDGTADVDEIMRWVADGRTVQVWDPKHETWMPATRQDRGSVRHWIGLGGSFRLTPNAPSEPTDLTRHLRLFASGIAGRPDAQEHWRGRAELVRSAANTIEAQAAEIERLRAAIETHRNMQRIAWCNDLPHQPGDRDLWAALGEGDET